MTKENPFFLLEETKRLLNLLQADWNFQANQMFVSKFGHNYDGNNVIGAGVKVYRKVGRKLYQVMNWYGGGATFEQEAFNNVQSKIEALGLEARYDCGTLD